MSPPRALHAENEDKGAEAPSASALAAVLRAFLPRAAAGAVLEDGKVLFELASAQVRVSDEGERCTLQVWSGDRNLVRTVVAVQEREGMLRVSTRRFGQPLPKMLVISAAVQRREPARREPARQAYLRVLQRVLAREYPEWQPEGFRSAMDLERSFGPAYSRGVLVRGKEAWAVIGVGATESQAIVDGVLTPGVLWLDVCRAKGDGRRVFKGLRVVVPRGAAALTLARMAWMNPAAAQWELCELDERTEELQPRDSADQGNLSTRLVHHPDEEAARERFAPVLEQVYALVPRGEEHRVEERLRSTSELAFLLHGLEFARARISLAPGSFQHVLEISVGVGAEETVLTPGTQATVAEHVAELFRRRDARVAHRPRSFTMQPPGRSIGAFTGRPAHGKVQRGSEPGSEGLSRLELRDRALAAQQDPLFRAAPERWLESVLRENLAPLTRSLAPAPAGLGRSAEWFANDVDPDTRGNRVAPETPSAVGWAGLRPGAGRAGERLIPRFDPRFVYTQVPAIAGARDRGMLDLLGVTEDGRLAVIELKASDDLQLAMQGLDYWIRVRHHHRSAGEFGSGGVNELQRHGYFRQVELSPLPPRLFLVAPALHVHPAVETVLRYFAPEVEWTLLALDERWRQEIRVVWRKGGGTGASATRGGRW